MSSATPSDKAVGGMAARSAGVRLIGAGNHSVNDASATPNSVAIMRYVRLPAVSPPPSSVACAVSTRAAPMAKGGMSGKTYCGSFDLLIVKNSSGPRTQQARRMVSCARGFTRRASQAQRQLRHRASAGTIHGNAAMGTIGR